MIKSHRYCIINDGGQEVEISGTPHALVKLKNIVDERITLFDSEREAENFIEEYKLEKYPCRAVRWGEHMKNVVKFK